MTYLLGLSHIDAIAQLAWSRALLAFDFDGTLAPIVRDRSKAAMRRHTQALLQEVCRLFPTAVISGRSRADVLARLGGAPVRYVVGNHGLEPGADLPETEAALNDARLALRRLATTVQGLDLEDKRYSLAVHYRRARRRGVARAAIQRALRRLTTPMRTIPGKCVTNIVPAAAPNKGDALLALRTRARADTALYVGDDVTDEDVFRLDQPGRLLTVRVGRSSTSRAACFLRDQAEIDALLEQFIIFRKNADR